MQVAELLFGANGRPHDYLQEALFRLLAVGFVGAAAENWVLKVCLPMTLNNPDADACMHQCTNEQPPMSVWQCACCALASDCPERLSIG